MSGFLKGIFGGKEEEEQVLGHSLGVDMREAQSTEQGSHDVDRFVESGFDDNGHDEATDAGGDQSMKLDNKQETDGPRVFDLDEVWNARNVTAQEQERVEKTKELLGGLPEGIPSEAKRQIVEASLKAFEVSIDDIVNGASHEIEALQVFISTTNSEADDFNADSKQRILELELEIDRIRETMKLADLEKTGLVAAANEVINTVTPILDFFVPVNSGNTVVPEVAPEPDSPEVAPVMVADASMGVSPPSTQGS